MSRARLGILVSGGGRSALNIARALKTHALPAEIAVVLAHREEIAAIERCRREGLRVAIVPDGVDLAARVDAVLRAAHCDVICLAGYLRHFRVGELWRGRTLNIHPGLLPEFGGQGMYGNHVHAAVIASGATETGCTVHEVDEEYDHGKPILELRCPVRPDDDVHSLATRVFQLECEAYPRAIAMFLAKLRSENVPQLAESCV